MARPVITSAINVNCPKCGTNITIAEISEGTTTRKTHKQMKAEAKLEALRNAGVNVDNLFSMKGVNGQETIARLVDGQLSIVPDDDPIFALIIDGGTVYNPQLARRWVMAQTFHMMVYRGCYGHEGFVAALQAKGYKYQWKMVLHELHVQTKLAADDAENFAARNRWFDAATVYAMCSDYLKLLRKYVEGLRERHCKGVPYVKVGRTNVFTSDLNSKLYSPLDNLARQIRYAKTADELYLATRRFVWLINKWWMPKYGTPMSAAFKDAYKGVGAYYTMKNLILYHGAAFKNGCVKMSQPKSLQLLEEKAAAYEGEGWRLFGVMKKLINDSNIDIKKKMAEWRK